jgi:hypothetical protein
MLEALQKGRVVRDRRPAEGEGALLVVVDSGGPFHARSLVEETVLVPLEHFGMPYRLLDLARERPSAAALAGCAGLVLAQDGLGDRLTQAETRLIAEAVWGGLGLVNFDWDLRRYDKALLEIWGIERVERLPIASDLFFVRDHQHYLTWLQPAPVFHRSKRMVTGLVVAGWREGVEPLVEMVLGKDQLVYIRHLVPGNVFEPKHYPAALAGRWGRGRAVQWTVNPRLWQAAALGHLGGLDDLFWRSLVWTARKPFVANMMPPFLTMSFDDCSGRQDFAYLGVAGQHGYRPLASLFIDDLRDRHLPILREKALAGEILVNTHAMSYYDLQLYDFGVGEHTEAALQARFARDDAFYQRLGVSCAKTMRDHWGEIGVRSLPFLKARGRLYINTPIFMGQHKADQIGPPYGPGYWPYNSTQVFYDVLPDDNDFRILGAFDERQSADFLTGTTQLLQESPVNDVAKAAERAAHQIRHGLGHAFYADLVTHEHKFSVLKLEEWDQILTRAHQLTSRFEKIHATYDSIARYVTDKDLTWVARAERSGGGGRCELRGRAVAPLRLSVFTDVDEGVERRFVEAPAFEGRTTLEWQA